MASEIGTAYVRDNPRPAWVTEVDLRMFAISEAGRLTDVECVDDLVSAAEQVFGFVTGEAES